MKAFFRGWLIPFVTTALLSGTAHAAPDRLNDDVPDAIPDARGSFSLSFGHESLSLDSPGSGETTAHMYFKGGYTFSDKVAVEFRITEHDLVGGLGLLSPLLDNHDGASSYGLDLRMNLLNVPATPADPDSEVPFSAGSAFNAGISGTQFQLDAGNLSRDETLLKAYLTYSTDLTEEMRAHTYFSTGRLSGDTHSGSMNRVGAGLDYTLIDGRRPLVLMANGILDIYNFREPSFNTGRVSRFDVGLRYRVARDWYASAGWVTANDSENEASGSGFFAGLNFISHPGSCGICGECGDCLQVGGTAEGAAAEIPAPVEEPAEAATQEVEAAVRGVAIPDFIEIPPQHTTDKSRLVRAGQQPVVPQQPAETQEGEAEPENEPPASEDPDES